jgi:hypothetical protein
MIRDVLPGSGFLHTGSRIRVLNPGVKKTPDPGSGSATLYVTIIWLQYGTVQNVVEVRNHNQRLRVVVLFVERWGIFIIAPANFGHKKLDMDPDSSKSLDSDPDFIECESENEVLAVRIVTK